MFHISKITSGPQTHGRVTVVICAIETISYKRKVEPSSYSFFIHFTNLWWLNSSLKSIESFDQVI